MKQSKTADTTASAARKTPPADAALEEWEAPCGEGNYTYIVQCADGSLYCGWTNRLDERIRAHNEGKGAKYTKGRRPVRLVYYESFSTKSEALRRECAIKKFPRDRKLALIAASAP